jgi:hypothetical protein
MLRAGDDSDECNDQDDHAVFFMAALVVMVEEPLPTYRLYFL